MSRARLWFLLLTLPACAAGPNPSLDGGPDARADAIVDAPSMLDAVLLDAPSLADAPLVLDAPLVSDVPDAPLVDASLSDAPPSLPDAPDAYVEVCGNGFVGAGERCDGDCPTSCSDGLACTEDALMGAACTRECSFAPVTACRDGDGCCPSLCTTAFDDDCACVPTASCAERTCGSVDDGCGRVLRCGSDCRTWTRVTPPPITGSVLEQLGTHRVLLFNTSSGRTFEYAAELDVWTETETLPGTSDTRPYSAAYAGNDRVVAISGSMTWEYDGTSHLWTAYGAAPPLQNAISYAGPGRVLGFGIAPPPSFDAIAITYVYSTTSHAWTELAIAAQPTPRKQGDLEWLGDGRLMLLGGLGNSTGAPPVLDDAWIFDTSTSRWTETTAPMNGGRYRGGVAPLATGTLLTYGGRGGYACGVCAPFGSQLFRRYEQGTTTWTVATSGPLTSPGILQDNRIVPLSPGRVFMLEGLWGTTPEARGYAWIYDDGMP